MAQLKSTTIYGDLRVIGTTTFNEDLYSSSIYLEEDGTSTYYLRLLNNSGLTANKTLTINTNNTDRTISLSGDLTVSSAATVSGTNTGDVTLATDHGLSLTNQVIGMGTPSTLTGTTTNAVTTTTHTHAITGAALSKTDDTNVTLTLGGSSSTALLNAASLTLGWTGTLAAARGGTGQSSYTTGDLLYASDATTLSKLADVATGSALISGGVGVAPSYGKIGLTTHISGTLAVGNGGTGVTTSTGSGSVVLSTSPSLTTPSLGVATATSINKVTITAPTTSATLTLVTGSSLITAGAYALTLTSSATTNATFPAGTITLMDLGTAQSVTGVKTYNSSALLMKGSSTGTTTIASANASATSYTLTMPAVTGNFAIATSSTGSIMVPASTTADRDGTPASGYFRYNTDTGKFEGYKASSWGSVGGGATGGGSDEIFIENGQTVTTNYTVTSGKNAGTFGPITVNTGITVTVPDGSVWTIV